MTHPVDYTNYLDVFPDKEIARSHFSLEERMTTLKVMQIGINKERKLHSSYFNFSNSIAEATYVYYAVTDNLLWPEGNRIHLTHFIQPALPEGERAVTSTALPICHQTNANLTNVGPTLNLSPDQQNLIAKVAHYKEITNNEYEDHLGEYNGPYQGEAPVALFYTQATTLNSLVQAIQDNMPSPSMLKKESTINLITQFKDPLVNIIKGNQEARKVRRHFGNRGNRGWFHICNVTFAPFYRRMKEELDRISNTKDYEAPFELWTDSLKETLALMVEAIVIAMVLSDDNYKREREEKEIRDMRAAAMGKTTHSKRKRMD